MKMVEGEIKDHNAVLVAGLLAGATSGVITKTATAPFERVKILAQVSLYISALLMCPIQ